MEDRDGEVLEAWSEDEPPTDAFPRQFGKFTLINRVAVGGMAEILLAKAQGPMGFEKPLVIKRILPELTRDTSFVEMFLSEAKIAARLHHPNVAQIYDIGRIDGQYFIAMEYVDGVTLMQVIKRALWRSIEFPIANTVHMIKEIALGLHYAHDAKDAQGRPLNLVHRDVSPSNIMVTRDGLAKLVDFGVATATNQLHKTQAGALKGKFGYMSPEQIEGESLDRRSDIFSLGVVLYEATTFRRLFAAKTPVETIRRVTSGKVPEPSTIVPDYPATLRDIIFKMLAVDREQRFATAREVHIALNSFVQASGARINSLEQGRVLGAFLDDESTGESKTLQSDSTTTTSGADNVPPAWITQEMAPLPDFDAPNIAEMLARSPHVTGPHVTTGPLVAQPPAVASDPLMLIAIIALVVVVVGSLVAWVLLLG